MCTKDCDVHVPPRETKNCFSGPDLTCSTVDPNAKKVSRACFFVSRACFSAEVPLLSPRCNYIYAICMHKCAFSVGKTSPRNLSQSRRNKNTTYVHSSGRRGLHLRCRRRSIPTDIPAPAAAAGSSRRLAGALSTAARAVRPPKFCVCPTSGAPHSHKLRTCSSWAEPREAEPREAEPREETVVGEFGRPMMPCGPDCAAVAWVSRCWPSLSPDRRRRTETTGCTQSRDGATCQ